MNLYKRQKELKLNINQSFTVVGCGGIGYWVCKYLALSGVEKIFAFDPDLIEEHNLNRLDLPFKFIGKNKTDVTKFVVNSLRPDCSFYAMPYKFNESHRTGTDWLIDCTDRDEAQMENQRIANYQNMRYFKAGYDGENMGLHNSVAEWGDSTDGYVIVPSWCVPASIIAAMAVAKVLKYPDKEMVTNIKGIFDAPRR